MRTQNGKILNTYNPANSLLKHFDFIMIDLICLQVSFLLAHWGITGRLNNPLSVPNHLLLMTVMLICQILTILFSNNYELIIRRGRYEELAKILRFIVMMAVFMLAILFVFQKTGEVSRLQTGWTFVIYLITDWIARTANKRRIHRHNKEGRGKTGIRQ